MQTSLVENPETVLASKVIKLVVAAQKCQEMARTMLTVGHF